MLYTFREVAYVVIDVKEKLTNHNPRFHIDTILVQFSSTLHHSITRAKRDIKKYVPVERSYVPFLLRVQYDLKYSTIARDEITARVIYGCVLLA